uniref:ODAD1 central coiled coil region domain-containing protein n=1 Tax=Odontella aurita TaxID=265563 RepID=A0A7S4K5X8_9STRA|mmetsp:Transcript_62451/g.184746  ORF Transcript_62451/g.184746 Transcript_62451/m.184746 type:complete len:410 (+) Transcript_62451:126-1355(+)
MIKYNEAQSIRSTYEHIVKRLKEERVSFDNQLTALERTLQAKHRDFEELLLLSSDANHAREVAQHELHHARRDYDSERVRREGELRERHQVVKVRRQMLEKQEQRRTKRKEMIDSQLAMEIIDSVGEAAARTYMSPPATAGSACVLDDETMQEQEENKIDIYENAFRKIKEATGVSNVNEVIQKIIGQESTTENMVSLTKQNQERIEELTGVRDELKKDVEEVKFSSSSSPQRRKAVDEKEEQLSSCTSKIERSKSKCERVAAALINLKAGVKHLQDKVDNVSAELRTDTKVYLTDKTLADILWSAGDILVELVARIREQEITEGVDLSSKLLANDDVDGIYEENMQEQRPYNQRVILPSMDDDAFDNDSNYDDGYGDVDEEEISRDKVKKASSQIIQAQERKKARGRT